MMDMTDDLPKRRWFRPTPGWLLVGLLVVEGLLWLSERFQRPYVAQRRPSYGRRRGETPAGIAELQDRTLTCRTPLPNPAGSIPPQVG